MKVKDESEKVGLKLNIQRTKIMASGPIASWQIDGETVERVRLYFWLWPNLDNILKTRDITLSTKVRLVKAMVFPVVMYGCESWTIKKAERSRIDAFELWYWRRLLRVRWTARRSNQSILKISPGCSLEGLMLKLKLQFFVHLMWRSELIWKDSDAGKDWGQEEKGTTDDEMLGWHHRLNGHEFRYSPGVGDGQGGLVCCSPWGCKVSDMTKRLNWTDTSLRILKILCTFT